MKTKRQILEENGWKVIIGYCFEYEKDENYNNIIITKEEIEKFLKKQPEVFYFNDEYLDNAVDEETAWEYFYDNWCDMYPKESQDIEFGDWESKMLGYEDEK